MKMTHHAVAQWFGLIAFVAFSLPALSQPIILTQPQGETVIIGGNASFSVTVAGSASSATLPTVTSGTLQLWLKADEGVITNAAGQVSQWQDQSGNTNNASQANTNNQPMLVNPPALGGGAAVRFNGIQDNVHGDYLHGTGNVGLTNAMTVFTVYNTFTTGGVSHVLWLDGVPGATYGASRGNNFLNGKVNFTLWAYDYSFSWLPPTNTYRVWTDRVNTNLTTVQMYDNAANSSTNFSATMSGAVTPSAGYYVGGLNPSLAYVSGDNYYGDIAELVIYKGYLTDADRLAVQAYLQQKYYLTNTASGVSFQWQFDGTNIADATNATLTLTDVQTNEAGSYSVIATNLAGSVTSSNAVLTVNPPPPCAPAPSDLISWWPAEGNANDIAGGNNGSLSNGAGFGPGVVGQAFTLNGTNQYVVVPDAPSLRPASLSVEGWFNIQAFNGVRVLVAKPYGAGTWDSFAVWYGSGALSGEIVTASAEEPVLSYTWSPASGSWHHIAYTYNAATALQTFYVDGLKVASSSASGPIAYDSHPFQIGADIENGVPAYFFDGLIDEVSLYSRALTAGEIAAIYNAGSSGKCALPPSILTQPQSQDAPVGETVSLSTITAGTPPLSYQWSLNGTNIANATNATLLLTNIAFTNAGSYVVMVTNTLGSATSSNAVLVVGNPPFITVEPQSQEAIQGTNVTLSVSVTGTAPFNYQWYLNGAMLAQGTSSALNLTNVQAAAVGSYSVTVSSPFGVSVSTNAVLTVALLPVIQVQPQSESVVDGHDVTLSVATAVPLPSVTSGTLQLWLKADAGLITNASGQVSRWQDQSGNTNDAVQANTNNQPLLVYPPAIGGWGAVRFNGIQDNVNGDYLSGAGDVGLGNAMTAFTVYNTFTTGNFADILWLVGMPGQVYGASRCDDFLEGKINFSLWAYDYSFSWLPPTNTYRIWTDRVNTNVTTVELFDNAANSSTNFIATMSGAQTPSPGYYVGGLDPSLEYVSGDNYYGDIAELVFYKGYLTDADRLAVQNYLQQKYFVTGVESGVTYQWQLDGTNITGATNATLTLTDVQTNEAGSYSVIVSNFAGSVTSSNAFLTVDIPPAITLQPQSQTMDAGGSVAFTAAASGTPPISYQWTLDDTNIAGATNSSLTLLNIQTNAAGTYQVIATSPYGSAVSSNAVLTVPISTVEASGVSTVGGGSVTVPVQLISLGFENAVGFSLDFDPTVLTYSSADLNSNLTGAVLLKNPAQSATGSLGIGVAYFGDETFSAGTQILVTVTFQIAVVTNATTTTLTFGSSPTTEQISGSQANQLPASFVPGVITISATPLEGDVAPRPNGDEALRVNDWVQEGRFVAGLDTISSPSEFQRADCSPRSTLGDGYITVADWTQVGRYAVGLDPLTPAGGPTGPPASPGLTSPIKQSLPDPVSLVPLSQGGTNIALAVQLVAKGTENALGFSVTFDPTTVQFAGATLSNGALGAYLITNQNQAASGAVGFLVGFVPPTAFAAGTQQVMQLTFASVSYSNNVVVAFADSPVACGLADVSANPVAGTFQSSAVAVGGAPWPALTVQQAQSSLVLSWPASAAGFELETTPVLGGTWSPVAATVVTNEDGVTLTVPISPAGGFFRLRHE